MKAFLVLLCLALPVLAQPPVVIIVPGRTGYEMNPAAQKQAERQALQEARKREAEERAYRQLLIEYLDRIANRRR